MSSRNGASNGSAGVVAGDPLYRVLGLLDGVRKQGSGWEAHCPGPRHAHGDRHASLSVATGADGRVLLDCKAGCETAEVLERLGLSFADLFEQNRAGNRVWRFRVVDAAGQTVATHVREDQPDGDKTFRWEANGKNGLGGARAADLPLYRLPELLADTSGRPVVVCEGEKATDAARELGLLAVGLVGGAGTTPADSVLAPLQGRVVWLWPDNDAPGRGLMAGVATRVQPAPRWIVWDGDAGAPEHGDAADYAAAAPPGGTLDGVAGLVQDAPAGVTEAAPRTDGAHPEGSPRLDVVRLGDVRPEPVRWLWKGRLARGKATLLEGDPGLGKSLLSHWLAAQVSTGGAWPDGGACERGTALLFTVEDGLADTVAPRLLAAGADMGRVLAVRGVIDGPDDPMARMFALTDHLALLDRVIGEHAVSLVVMDPITAYLGPDVNAHREADVRAVLAPLTMLAERHDLVLLMLMHLNKGSGVSALYRSVGSIAFPALARVVLGVAPDPNDDEGRRRLLLPIKMNIGLPPAGLGYRIRPAESRVLAAATEADQPPVLVWDDEPVTVDATSAMDRNGTAAELGAVADVKRALLQILAHGRVLSSEAKRQLVDATGCKSEQTIQRARTELGVRSTKEGYQGPWYWEPPRFQRNEHDDSSEPSVSFGAFEESIGTNGSKERFDEHSGEIGAAVRRELLGDEDVPWR